MYVVNDIFVLHNPNYVCMFHKFIVPLYRQTDVKYNNKNYTK